MQGYPCGVAIRTWSIVGTVMCVIGLGVSGVDAAAAPPARSAAGSTALTFSPEGREQTYVVPRSVRLLSVVAAGAPGQYYTFGTAPLPVGGGYGARVIGDLDVSGGEVLYVEVGGIGGTQFGGFNGGGAGGGGDASDVRTCSTSAAPCPDGSRDSLDSRLLIAGGGGAPGMNFPGPPGPGGDAARDGAPGGNGTPYTPGTAGYGGGGGSRMAGGAGGAGATANPPDPTCESVFPPGMAGLAGGSGIGGAGGGRQSGGGGGGYWGGGGGGSGPCSGGGGGGGSSYGPTGTSFSVDTSAKPSITITALHAPMVEVASPRRRTYTIGQRVAARDSCRDGLGGPGLASCHGTVRSGSRLATRTTGSHIFSVVARSRDGLRTTKVVRYGVKRLSVRVAGLRSA
jgi:hypothetical protein